MSMIQAAARLRLEEQNRTRDHSESPTKNVGPDSPVKTVLGGVRQVEGAAGGLGQVAEEDSGGQVDAIATQDDPRRALQEARQEDLERQEEEGHGQAAHQVHHHRGSFALVDRDCYDRRVVDL